MSHRHWDLSCKIYIGGLKDDANRYDIEDAFAKYGPVRDVWVARKPPGFAFVEMEDPRDAEDAARSLDGTRICGARCRVEMSEPGKRRGRGGGRRSRSRSRSPRRSRRSPSYGRRRSPSPRRSRRSPSYDRKRSVSRDRRRSDSPRDRSYKKEERSRSRS